MCTLRLGAYFIISSLIFSLFLVGGCKKDSTTSPQQGQKPTIVSFTADPSSVAANGDSVKLSWQVKNATDLTISPGIGTVTPTDSGSTTVFVTAATTYTLEAKNSVGTATATANVSTGQTITVNGFVKDIDGEPISGVTVIIKGQPPTTTNADGSFNISNVVTPYEARIIISTQQSAIIYQGLTRSDPSLLYLSSTTSQKSADISGVVPAAVGKKTIVYFISEDLSFLTVADQATGAYTLSPGWRGSMNSLSGQLQVLRWSYNTNGLPIQYDAYVSKNITISDGGTFSGNDFSATDFTDPAEQSLSGTIVLPTTSYKVGEKSLYINFGSAFVFISSEAGTSLAENFSYIVPSITGATFEVDVYSTVSAIPNSRQSTYKKKGITGGSAGITITLAAAPQLSLPVHNGTGVDTTTQFLWTQGGGTGVNLVLISPTLVGNGPLFFIFTSANNTAIPNLSPLGLGLPSSVSYEWYVTRVFPVTSIDDAASDSFTGLVFGYAGDTGQETSERFSFTTHP